MNRLRGSVAFVWLRRAARHIVAPPRVILLVMALLVLPTATAVAVRNWPADSLGAQAQAPQGQDSPQSGEIAPQEQASPPDALWEDPPPCDPAELARPYDDAPPPHPLEGGDPVCKAPPGQPIPWPAGRLGSP